MTKLSLTFLYLLEGSEHRYNLGKGHSPIEAKYKRLWLIKNYMLEDTKTLELWQQNLKIQANQNDLIRVNSNRFQLNKISITSNRFKLFLNTSINISYHKI
jgi:hypothetical protein